jgi:hypothetical protein
MTRKALLLLLALCCASGCQAADAADQPAPTLVSVDTAADCVRLTGLLLRQDLLAVAGGRVGGPDLDAELRATYGSGSPLLQKVERVHSALLVTATGDLLGLYGRDVAAELSAYRPRVLAGCAF